MTSTEQDKELREKLAAIEHERWADWQRYVHSVCYENKGIGGEPTGELTIPSELAGRCEGQIETPYHELSEKEKDSDREQVDRYWQLITADRRRVALEARIDELEHTFVSYDNALASELVENPEWEYGQAVERIAELKQELEKL